MSKVTTARVENSGLNRGLLVLSEISNSRTPLRFADLQTALDVPKSTLNRLLSGLQLEGMVRFDDSSQTYSIGYRLLELANTAWKQSDVRQLAQPLMLELAEMSGESVQLAVLVDTKIVYLSQVESGHSVRYSISVGDSAPVYCTGVGKAMLAAFLPEQQQALIKRLAFKRLTQETITEPALLQRELRATQKCGFAVDNEEHQHGIRCVAAPILDSHGNPVAAISVTAPTFRATQEDFMDWGQRVKKAANTVSLRLQPEASAQVEVR